MIKKHKVIKNFLDKDIFLKIQKELFSTNFSWFWQNYQHDKVWHKSIYTHNFYIKNRPYSDFFEPMIRPIIEKLNCNMLSDVRANCSLIDTKRQYSDFHTDRRYKCKSAIFYMNTCNGYTVLGEKEKIKIKCVENSMLIFDSQIKHSAASQTDKERRIVININYI